ncbi:hypothetical protein ACSQ67_014715 [Phaseolus vulgaris]
MKTFPSRVSRNHTFFSCTTSPSPLRTTSSSSSSSFNPRVRVSVSRHQNVQENHERRAQEALQVRGKRSRACAVRRRQPQLGSGALAQCRRQPRLARSRRCRAS